MARIGLSDPRTLLEPRKAEERPPLRTWANVCGTRERWGCADGEKRKQQNKHIEHRAQKQDQRQVHQLLFSAEEGIYTDYNQTSALSPVDDFEQDPVLNHLQSLQVSPALRELLPGLLHRDMEMAMDKLGLLYDRTYAWDVFSDMMRSQLRCTLPSPELPRPFSENTRAILVDWLIQVHEVFNFSEETLYLAIHLLNRALRCVKVSISRLQLLGVTCLFIAAKREECLLPEVSELCYLMGSAYSRRELVKMERRVLSALQFDLFNVPPIHFLLLSAFIARCSDQVVCMARYLLELSLLEGQCVVHLPVQLAGAALRLARTLIQDTPTPETDMAWHIASTIHVGSEGTLFSIMQVLSAAAVRASGRETRASFMKFSTAETLQVSLHPALTGAPCQPGLHT